jgi:hypothetical protein
MAVRLGQPEPPGRVPFRVELDHDRRLAPDHPRVVTGLDDEDPGRGELEAAAVRVLAVDVAFREEPR